MHYPNQPNHSGAHSYKTTKTVSRVALLSLFSLALIAGLTMAETAQITKPGGAVGTGLQKPGKLKPISSGGRINSTCHRFATMTRDPIPTVKTLTMRKHLKNSISQRSKTISMDY